MDSHVHAGWTGLAEMALDLFAVRDVGEVAAALRERAASTPPGQSIVGMRLEWRFLRERRWPTLAEVEAAAPDHPVAFLHLTGHEMLLNRAALRQIRAAGQLPDETPGIARDEAGEPTGLLTDRANSLAGEFFLLRYGREVGWGRVLAAAAARAVQVGLTTLHCLDPLEVIEVLLPLQAALPVRTVAYTEDTDIARVHALGLPRVGGCRAWWVDGDFDPHTAALLEPYDDCPTSTSRRARPLRLTVW